MSAERDVQRYPLTWPIGWKRAEHRRRAAFKSYRAQVSVMTAVQRLEEELRRLGARHEVLSTNVVLRLDGRPRSDQEPSDPGAACYFQLEGKPTVLACDKWDRVADNITAIAAHIDATRRIDRYGVGTLAQAFAGYAALAPTALDWWLVLEVPRTATLTDVEEAFRRLAKELHPDAGGSHEAMARLTEARVYARRELGAPA